ncbi:hypothetical protein DFJ63DRAFT_333629 [Scheffersomyces coipomensis]|uniref:uncharacterized protein n=1 Tax=Scheffersomyces coipomensis TaxID=1788519 RepID=UPI00315D4B8B
MSISNTAVIGCIIALFGLIILCTIIISVILCVTSRISSSYEKGQNDNGSQHKSFNLFHDLLRNSSPKIDLEAQNHTYNDMSSTIVLKSFPMSLVSPTEGGQNHVSDDGGLLVTISRDDRSKVILGTDGTAAEESDYRSAIESFHTITDGLEDRKLRLKKSIRRMSSVHYKRSNDNTLSTIVAIPNERKQSYIADQYDSFSRTLMLQNMIQTSVNDDNQAIMQVRDPFSNSLIKVGGMVVVVKPFHGTEEFEFNTLETGDLLRIVKFYIKEDEEVSIKPLRIISDKQAKNNSISVNDEGSRRSTIIESSEEITINGYSVDEDVFIDRSDLNYSKLYCTGIILNSCLEFNNNTSDLSLRIKDNIGGELEFLKDFPLEIVSLETTVLRSMHDVTLSSSHIEEVEDYQ